MYENPYALPLAFNVSSDLYDDIEYGQNPFENQEKYVSSALGRDVSLFFTPDYENGEMKDKEQKITVHIKQDGPLYFIQTRMTATKFKRRCMPALRKRRNGAEDM